MERLVALRAAVEHGLLLHGRDVANWRHKYLRCFGGFSFLTPLWDFFSIMFAWKRSVDLHSFKRTLKLYILAIYGLYETLHQCLTDQYIIFCKLLGYRAVVVPFELISDFRNKYYHSTFAIPPLLLSQA